MISLRLHALAGCGRRCAVLLRLSFGAFAVDTEESARRGQHQKTWQMAMLVCCLGKLDRRVQTAETMSIYCLRHEARTGQIAKILQPSGCGRYCATLSNLTSCPVQPTTRAVPIFAVCTED